MGSLTEDTFSAADMDELERAYILFGELVMQGALFRAVLASDGCQGKEWLYQGREQQTMMRLAIDASHRLELLVRDERMDLSSAFARMFREGYLDKFGSVSVEV